MSLCLADAVHNAAGFGISGRDEKGRVSWDLVSNIHIWEIEASLKEVAGLEIDHLSRCFESAA